MAETINMPKLGFDMAEGTLVRWVIQEGEPVEKNAVIAEIETDKATVEVNATAAGQMLKHMVDEGSVVPVGSPIAVVGEAGESLPEADNKQETTDEKTAVDPSKAEIAQNVKSPAAEAQPAEGESQQVVTEPKPETAEQSAVDGFLRVSPIARKMLQDQNIDPRNLTGSGPEGRIVKKDVESFLQMQKTAPATADAKAPKAKVSEKSLGIQLPVEQIPEDQSIPMARLRQAIGRRMVESKTTIPHFYLTYDYDVAMLLTLRKQVNAILPDNEKLSVNDFIVRATALALRQFPNLNSSIVDDAIVQKGHINVGIAVAVENGLLTVVVKDADQKSVRDISAEVKEMAARVRSGKVKPDDIEGSSFSISNLGMFDAEHFIAIINPPEAAILAVGAAKEMPVVSNGALTVGSRMKATISADHRITDGAEAAQFMQVLGKWLENPAGLLL